MSDWHHVGCRRPHVFVNVEGMFSNCLNCGAISFTSTPKCDPGSNPSQHSDTRTGAKPLSWPSSVEYLFPRAEDEPALVEVLDELYQRQCAKETQTIGASNDHMPAEKDNSDLVHSIYPKLPKSSSHIRLLRLYRGTLGEELHGQVDIVDLSGSVNYEAVSYTWADKDGEKSLCRQIFLGVNSTPLPITLNCYRALKSLRREETDIVLWIDAICIDQHSTAERSHQVGLMAKIFSSATNVCVYIGEGQVGEDAIGAEAIKLLNRFAEDDKTNDSWYDTFGAIFRRPYFSRLWVVQEVLLARSLSLHCGTASTELSTSAVSVLKAKLPDIPSWINLLPRSQDAAVTLKYLLGVTSKCHSSDLRDKVFGVLGLLENTPESVLEPDYSLTVPEVLIGTATHIIQSTGSLDILRQTGLGLAWLETKNIGRDLRNAIGIPSWVPLWVMPSHDFLSSDGVGWDIDEDNIHRALNTHSSGIYGRIFLKPLHPLFQQASPAIPNSGLACHAKVHGYTGALVVEGCEVKCLQDLVGPAYDSIDLRGITLPRIELGAIYESVSENGRARTTFKQFDDSTIIVVKSAINPLGYERNRILAVDGCDDFLVVSAQTDLSFNTYEVVGRCRISTILARQKLQYIKTDKFLQETRSIFFQLFPSHRRFMLIFELDKILQAAETPRQRDWRTSCSSVDKLLRLWHQYSRLYYETPRPSHEVFTTEIQNLIDAWNPERFASASRLASCLEDMYQISTRLGEALKYLRSSRNDTRNEVIVGEAYGFIWGGRFSEYLEAWRTDCRELARITEQLFGAGFLINTVLSGEVVITEDYVEEIYQAVQILLTRHATKEGIVDDLTRVPVVGDGEWSTIEKYLDVFKDARKEWESFKNSLSFLWTLNQFKEDMGTRQKMVLV
ncbi:heterokaryon incompatibility protein-domain-containing protein [Biscogniauxia mediterranea]|nr:heterokaryon incompatibility protein-domain-containing protein [Biscogniauxia mediterranea]